MEIKPNEYYTIKGKQYQVPNLIFKDKQYHISQDTLDGLYDLLKHVTVLFKKHDICIFAIAGTLLSAARHQAFMPWDDDIDMGYFYEDHQKIKDIEKEIRNNGQYRLIEGTPGFIIQSRTNSRVAMDCMAINKNPKTNKYEYCGPHHKGKNYYLGHLTFPKETYEDNDLDNLLRDAQCNVKETDNVSNPSDEVFKIQRYNIFTFHSR